MFIIDSIEGLIISIGIFMTEELPLFAISQDDRDFFDRTPDEGAIMSSDFSKFVVYVDESGDHSLKKIDPHYPIFVLAFCIFHKRHYSEVIVPALEKLKFNYFGHDQVVLHENEIRRRKGIFSCLHCQEKRRQFMEDITRVIENSNFIIVSATIDKNKIGTNNEGNAYDIALKMCMESLFEFLKEKGEEQQTTHIIVESRGTKEDRELEL